MSDVNLSSPLATKRLISYVQYCSTYACEMARSRENVEAETSLSLRHVCSGYSDLDCRKRPTCYTWWKGLVLQSPPPSRSFLWQRVFHFRRYDFGRIFYNNTLEARGDHTLQQSNRRRDVSKRVTAHHMAQAEGIMPPIERTHQYVTIKDDKHWSNVRCSGSSLTIGFSCLLFPCSHREVRARIYYLLPGNIL